MSNKKAAGTLRERLISAATIKTKKVSIPEWGEAGELTIRQLSADSIISKRISADDSRESSARDIIESIIDEKTGKPIFSEADIPAILDFELKGFIRLMVLIKEFNGADKEAVKKNSEKTPSLPSHSDSQSV